MKSMNNDFRIPSDTECEVGKLIAHSSVELLKPEAFIARPLFTRMLDVLIIDATSVLHSYNDIEITFDLDASNTLIHWMLITQFGSCAIYHGAPDRVSSPTDECGDPYQGDRITKYLRSMASTKYLMNFVEGDFIYSFD